MKGFGRFLVKSTPEGDIQLVRIVTTLVRVMVQFLYQEERKITADNAPMVGIDVGVKAQATLSTVEGLPQVVIDTTRQKRLQRRVSAATKGSANRESRNANRWRERRTGWQRGNGTPCTERSPTW